MERFQALTRMCLNNWHYINRKMLSFHRGINFFTGHSGSGKSTVLDAMQVVLYADTNGRNFFNKAAKEDSDRSLLEYLRGMKNVQENGSASYLRNQNFSSTIVLEFLDTQAGSYQSIGVVFDVDTGTGGVNRLFFRHSGRFLENSYQDGERVLSCAQVRDFLKANFPKEEIFYTRTNETFRAKLYEEFLGGLDERKFISLFKRAIPFRMDMKLEEFVREYICTEQDIRIGDMQESVTQYIRLKRRLEEVREEIGCLEQERAGFVAYSSTAGEREQLSYFLDRLELSGLEEEMAASAGKQKAKQELMEEASAAQGRLGAELATLKQRRDNALLALENSGYAHLERERASCLEKLARKQRSLSQWERLEERLGSYEAPLFCSPEGRAALLSFRERSIGREGLCCLKEEIAALREGEENRLFEAKRRYGELAEEIAKDRQEDAALREGQKVYPGWLLNARDALKEALEKECGSEVPVDIFADRIEVEDDTWRNAVEGYLGSHKLDLLVPPFYAKTALKLYRLLDAGAASRVAVVDTERVAEWHKGAEPAAGALSEEVSAASAEVQGYVDFLLGNVMKCRSVEELRQVRVGVTPDCMLYKGFRLQHISPKNYQEYACIGRQASERRRALLAERIAGHKAMQEPYAKTIQECQAFLAQERLEQDPERYLELLSDIRELPGCEEALQQLDARLGQMKEQDLEALRAELEDAEQAIRTHESAREQAVRRCAGAEKELERAKAEYVSLNEAWMAKRQGLQEQPALAEGYARFLREARAAGFGKTRARELRRLTELREREERQYGDLLTLRQEYAKRYPHRGFSMSTKGNAEYDRLFENLSSEKLGEFLERADSQARIAMRQFKTDFVFKIRAAIKDALRQADELNQVLDKLNFGKDRYHFVIGKNRGEEGKFYDMFLDEALEVNPGTLGGVPDSQMDLFSIEHESKYGAYMKELLELFIPPEDGNAECLEEARRNLERYADYRTYLSFDMEQRVEGLPVMRLSRMLSKNSGGEGQNPLYVALLASFAIVYRITGGSGGAAGANSSGRRPTPRLVVLDEAFSKMDAEKVGSCIGLIRKLGIQAVISATNDKIQNYLDNVDKTFVYANPNKTQISIEEFEREELGGLYRQTPPVVQ